MSEAHGRQAGPRRRAFGASHNEPASPPYLQASRASVVVPVEPVTSPLPALLTLLAAVFAIGALTASLGASNVTLECRPGKYLPIDATRPPVTDSAPRPGECVLSWEYAFGKVHLLSMDERFPIAAFRSVQVEKSGKYSDRVFLVLSFPKEGKTGSDERVISLHSHFSLGIGSNNSQTAQELAQKLHILTTRHVSTGLRYVEEWSTSLIVIGAVLCGGSLLGMVSALVWVTYRLVVLRKKRQQKRRRGMIRR
ncbi:hypothetical protein QOT17_004438 [Balamuthia mandrillaris]